MHKAPYWSVNNYEQRVDEGVRTVFWKHVEKVHTDYRQELAGMFGEALALSFQVCSQCISPFGKP
jgi:hypothetical protein